MALVTHHVQGSYVTFPSSSVSQYKGKQYATTLRKVVNTDKFPALVCKSCLSVRAPVVRGPNAKSFKIKAFKGNAEQGGRGNGSNSAKNSPKLSYMEQERESNFTKSPKVYETEVERISGSLAIQNLFKNWLLLLRTPPSPSLPPPNEATGEIVEESYHKGEARVQDVVPEGKKQNIFTAIWSFFWGLNASVKVPLLLFTPLYLGVTVAYGPQVSKELTPLWIFGPLITALYIKIMRGISALYVFTFKQTVKVVKNSPAYITIAYKFVATGKLKEEIYARTWQPVLDIKNKDYNEFFIRKMKEFQVWVWEKYLDYVESIWPTYCRFIRFLKRANLI